MNFLSPTTAAIAGAVAIPTLLILYFLKLRRRDMEISSTLLWKKAIQDLQANAPFQKLRRNILLFLQMIALLIAIFALAQPELSPAVSRTTNHIILIDRSASMNAVDPDAQAGLTRLELAKRKAIEIVDGLQDPGLFDRSGAREQAMVIAFDTTADPVQPFTSSKSALRAAIRAIEPTDAPADVGRAFLTAKAYTGRQKFEDQVERDQETGRGFVPATPGATLHLVSDGRLRDVSKVSAELQDSVVYHMVGSAESANLGITALSARRPFNDPGQIDIFVQIQNASLVDQRVEVELVIEGQTVAVEEVGIPGLTLEPNRADPEAGMVRRTNFNGPTFKIRRSKSGVATVRVRSDAQDALATDNSASIILPPAQRLNVALVSEGNLFIQTVLEGLDLSSLELLTPGAYQRLLDAGEAEKYDAVILDGVLPIVTSRSESVAEEAGQGASEKAEEGAEQGAEGGTTPDLDVVGGAGVVTRRGPGLPAGRFLVLGAVPTPPLGVVEEGLVQNAVFVDWRRDHPALQNAGLSRVNVSRTRGFRLAKDSPVRIIAYHQEGPAIAEVTGSATRAIIVPFDPVNSDWPFDVGWPLFIASSILYLADADTSDLGGEMVTPGSTLSTRLPFGAEDIRLREPNGREVPLQQGRDGRVEFGPVRVSGIYEVSWSGAGFATDLTTGDRSLRRIAANLLDPNESDVASAEKLPLRNQIITAGTQAQALVSRKLWPWFVGVAVLVILFEWWVYNRKVYI